jgi:hypothetical protein
MLTVLFFAPQIITWVEYISMIDLSSYSDRFIFDNAWKQDDYLTLIGESKPTHRGGRASLNAGRGRAWYGAETED